jgi:hypothetical protein
MSRSVITLAAGNPIFWYMAINLARSFIYWHRESDIRFSIVTDLHAELPSDLERIDILRQPPASLGRGFSSKLQLDQFTFTDQTLFIDADCLCVGKLDSCFDRFAGRPVAVVGGAISRGEWFGDVPGLLQRFGLSQMPKFNGGIYYLEAGAIATSVYEKARELEKHYDGFGLVRLRGRPNDELLMALAMSLHGLESLPDDGTIMGDLYSCPEILKLDVTRGKASLRNPPPPHDQHRPWFPHLEIQPIIIHFLGNFTEGWQYKAETLKLRLIMSRHWPVWLAEFFVAISFSVWHRVGCEVKNTFRPLYHFFFGIRAIRLSPRM